MCELNAKTQRKGYVLKKPTYMWTRHFDMYTLHDKWHHLDLRVSVHMPFFSQKSAVRALSSAGMKGLCAERKNIAYVSCCHDNNTLTRAAV